MRHERAQRWLAAVGDAPLTAVLASLADERGQVRNHGVKEIATLVHANGGPRHLWVDKLVSAGWIVIHQGRTNIYTLLLPGEAERLTVVCPRCGRRVWRDRADFQAFRDAPWLCTSCAERLAGECEHCGSGDKCARVDGHDVCFGCACWLASAVVYDIIAGRELAMDR